MIDHDTTILTIKLLHKKNVNPCIETTIVNIYFTSEPNQKNLPNNASKKY